MKADTTRSGSSRYARKGAATPATEMKYYHGKGGLGFCDSHGPNEAAALIAVKKIIHAVILGLLGTNLSFGPPARIQVNLLIYYRQTNQAGMRLDD